MSVGMYILPQAEGAGSVRIRLYAVGEPVAVDHRAPFSGLVKFGPGDMLAIGDVTVTLAVDGKARPGQVERTEDIADVVSGALRDASSGWRGYRRALDKAASFISPEDAQKAERWHVNGLAALLRFMAVCLGLVVASDFLESREMFRFAHYTAFAADVLLLFSLFYTTVRYRIRFVGRILLLMTICQMSTPPYEAWPEYFGSFGTGAIGLVILPMAFLIGWLYDMGAGCVFEKVRLRFFLRYMLLVFVQSMLFALEFLARDESAISPYWYVFEMAMVLAYPLWAKLIPTDPDQDEPRVSFVEELASMRTWRTWEARGIAVFAVTAPIIHILANLGRSAVCSSILLNCAESPLCCTPAVFCLCVSATRCGQ